MLTFCGSLTPANGVSNRFARTGASCCCGGRHGKTRPRALLCKNVGTLSGSERRLTLKASMHRIGHGFDLHRLEPGLPLILGGVRLEHDRGSAAHSDGDAVYHAVTDAILGALALPDIGQMFPDSDPQWKGASSDVFMKAAGALMQQRGYQIANLDVTVILERPKLAPHKEQIRQNIAGTLGLPLEQVNLKAKTHEKVDSIGENRSIGCHAVVLLERLTSTSTSDMPAETVESKADRGTDSCSRAQSEWKQGVFGALTATLERVQEVIQSRRGADPESSWTAKLFSKGRHKIAQKVGEEALEVALDAVQDRPERVVEESADLLYHLLVLWADIGIQPVEVAAELEKREGKSGVKEKMKRNERKEASEQNNLLPS
jgi:2-C-methyl-D-erythritol 2,4-cyclodiphosphate synthase